MTAQITTPPADPSTLTTQHMLRETEALRELVFREILALEKNMGSRMDAMDKATVLLHDDFTRWPTTLDRELAHIKELHAEKFSGVGSQLTEKFLAVDGRLKERDVRFDAAERANKSNVENAFQAAKEAVGKSEAATSKQIDQLASQVTTNNKSLDDKINDLKEQFIRFEGKSAGGAATRQDRRSLDQNMVGLIGLIVGSLIGIAGLMLHFMK